MFRVCKQGQRIRITSPAGHVLTIDVEKIEKGKVTLVIAGCTDALKVSEEELVSKVRWTMMQ
jgi:hypothetical protein